MSLLDREKGCLILGLPVNLEKEAIYEIFQFIPPQKVVKREFGRHGLKIFFTEYDPVRKVLAKRRLHIKGSDYPIHLLVTPLTIHKIKSLIEESKLRKLIEAWDIGIWLMYPETRPVNNAPEPTGNYRVLLLNSDAENVNFPNFLKDPELNMKFEVTLYCRRCMENGHSQYQCQEQGDIPKLGETSINKHEAQRDNPSRGNHTTGVDGIDLLLTEMKQRQEWDEACNIYSSLNNDTQGDVPCFWTSVQSDQDWVSARVKNERSDVKESIVPSSISRAEKAEDITSFIFNSAENSNELFSRHSFKTEYDHSSEQYGTSFLYSSYKDAVVHGRKPFHSLDYNKSYSPKMHTESSTNFPPQSFESEPRNRIDYHEEHGKHSTPRGAEGYNIREITSNYTDNCPWKRNKGELTTEKAEDIPFISNSAEKSSESLYRHSFKTDYDPSNEHYRTSFSKSSSKETVVHDEKPFDSPDYNKCYLPKIHIESSTNSPPPSFKSEPLNRMDYHKEHSKHSSSREAEGYSIRTITSNYTNNCSWKRNKRESASSSYNITLTSYSDKNIDRNHNRYYSSLATSNSKSCRQDCSTSQLTNSLSNVSLTSSETDKSSRRTSSDIQNSERGHSYDHLTNPLKALSPCTNQESNHQPECNNQLSFCYSGCLKSKSKRYYKQECSSSSSEMDVSNAQIHETVMTNRNTFKNLSASINCEDIELNVKESRSDSDSNFESDMSQNVYKLKTENRTSAENKLNLTDLLPPSLKNKVKEIKNVICKIMGIGRGMVPELTDMEIAAVEVIINNNNHVKLAPHQRRFLENLELCLEKLNGLEKIIKTDGRRSSLPNLSNNKGNSPHSSSDESLPGIVDPNSVSKHSKSIKLHSIFSKAQHSAKNHNEIFSSKTPVERFRKSSETDYAARRCSSECSFRSSFPDSSNAGKRLGSKSLCHKTEKPNTFSINSHRRNLNKNDSGRTFPYGRNLSPSKKKTTKYKRSISQPSTYKSGPFATMKKSPSTISTYSNTQHLPTASFHETTFKRNTSSEISQGEASSSFCFEGYSSAYSNCASSSTYFKEGLPSTSKFNAAYDTKNQESSSKKFFSSQTSIKDVSHDQLLQPKICYEQNEIPKELNSKCKTQRKVVLRSSGFSKKGTPGLWAANQKTSSIMDKSKFILFSTHVRRKRHLGPMVFKYAKSFDQVIRKVDAVLEYFYERKLIGRDDNSEVRILEDLQKRLENHMMCEICLRSENIT